MKPPYSITAHSLQLIASICEKIGEIKSAYLHRPPTQLRKRNRIRTIHSSLEIEGNTLTITQITALLDNQRVVAPAKDIAEVKNAIEVYDKLSEFKPYSLDSLCSAHKILMNGLVATPGKLRTSNVGIVKGDQRTHLAPPSERLKPLLAELLQYAKSDPDLLLVKSCVFHYEFEFIHPFTDGNGRMGRLWQTVLLRQYNPLFEYLPIETIIKKRQVEYYDVLGRSDMAGNSTAFIEFMLAVINDSLEELLQGQNVTLTGADRIELFRAVIKDKQFSRADYLRQFKDISTATASRDLSGAVASGQLKKTGEKRLTAYQYA